MAGLTYLEEVETESPSSSGFSMDGGRAVSTYQLVNPSAADLLSMITEVLGKVNTTASGDGRLNRTPPMGHPLYSWMTAFAITSIRGVGTFTTQNAQPFLEVPTLPQFALYSNYRVQIEFRPRSYPVLTDDDVHVVQGSWFPDSDKGPAAMPATPAQTFNYATEWERYTDFPTLDPTNNFVTVQQGEMGFVTSGGPANNTPFTASPRMYMPDQMFKYILRQVPYRWISSNNSYIVRWVGRINQNAFNGIPAGSLLYMGYKPILYTPPSPTQVANQFGNAWVFSAEKLCDIEFTFMYTSRTATDSPTAPSSKCRNFVTAGWNLLPFTAGDRQFHYAETHREDVTGANRVPSWRSFPLEVLWTDPDSPNSVIG